MIWVNVFFLCLLLILDAKTSEKLSVHNNILSIHFNLTKQFLPEPLQLFLNEKQSIAAIDIEYGNKWKGGLQDVPVNGIRVWLNNSTSISQKTKQLLAGTFSISVQPQFTYLFPGQLLISDPNDKFCVNHVEQIVRNFLPCQQHSGLAQLIKTSSFFQGGYVGMNIKWRNDWFFVDFFIELKNPIENLNKIKILQKCEYFDQIQMKDAKKEDIFLNQVVTTRILESIKGVTIQPHKQKIQVSQQIIGDWYSPQKILFIKIQANVPHKTELRIPEIFPEGFQVNQIKVYNHAKSKLKQNPVRFYSQFRKHFKDSVQYQITFFVQPDIRFYFLKIHLQTKILNFDVYESIYGGGEELPVLPLILGKVEKYYARPVAIRRPDPDFSLPFQVMTFTMAAIGYLWLAVWRAYFSQSD